MSMESVQELIIKAHECIQNSDLNGAMEVGKEILEKDTDNCKGLEIMGYILLEMNCVEEAKYCFTKSIENKSDDSHVPYLYLGQLTEGEESAKYFIQAIEMMLKNISPSIEKKILFRPTKLDVSNAYVSLCELYMTDLCDKEDAEIKCNDYITKAIEVDETNPAAWQSLASLNLIKNDKESCVTNIKKSIEFWLPEAMKIVSNADNEECTNDILTTCELSADLRSKTAEILFECGLLTEMRMVLETIIIEDDEFFQGHYLMALCLEALLDSTTIDSEKAELVSLVEDHAEMAMGLANPVLEADAVTKMMNLLEKIGVDREEDNDMSSGEDYSDDDDEEMAVEEQ